MLRVFVSGCFVLLFTCLFVSLRVVFLVCTFDLLFLFVVCVVLRSLYC